MARRQEDERPKIQMLLDIENIFGESTRGLGQLVLTLCLCLIPPAFIGYTALYLYIPWQILLVVCLVFAVRVVLVVMGHESQRVKNFKKQRDDVYSLTDDMVNIRRIHPQGCVEYINGNIGFFIVTYNSSSNETLEKSKQIDRFINLAVGKHAFDIYVQNDVSTEHLDNKYNNVTLFGDDEAANAFMEIIDYNREVVRSSSTLTRNIIFVRGSKYQWKEIVNDIQTALTSESARVFRQCYLATDREEIENIISRDINGYIDLDKLLQRKYYTGNKHGSKIISYDFEDREDTDYIEETKQEELTSFIPRA